MQKKYIFVLITFFFLSVFSGNAFDGKITVLDTSYNLDGISSLSFTGGTSLSVSLSSTAETCTASNGTATASVSGGTGIISYIWSNGNSGATITNLPSGTYTVTASDEAGCSGIASTVVNQDIIMLNVATVTTDETCSAADGTATASASGGTAAYSYLWSNSGSSAAINSLIANTYTVTATDANGCTGSASAVVNKEVTVLTTEMSVTDVICTANNGTANVSVTGGTGAYSYNWSVSGSTAALTNLSPNSYSVTVTDVNGCQGIVSGTVGQEIVSLSLSGSSTASSGSDGTATASASGGTAAYNYSWDTGGMTATITGLAPDTYNVTATDVNGCVGNTSVIVDAVLPVELLSFSGIYQNGVVSLIWSTAQEVNNKGFYIEKLSSGDDWESIGFIYGSGTIEIQQEYEFIDKEPELGISYYRLKQVDLDGAFSYSNIISIALERELTDLLLFPNPVAGNLINLQFPSQNEENLQFVVLNQLGSIISTKDYVAEQGENNLSLSIADLPSGLYYLKVISSRKAFFKEFIIE